MMPLLQLDPCEHYEKARDFSHRGGLSLDQCLIEACGLLPHFVTDDDDPIRTNLDKNYQFGMSHSPQSSVDDEGIHTYPGDPPLHPYLKITKGDETMWVYPYALVSIHEADGSWFHTRMD